MSLKRLYRGHEYTVIGADDAGIKGFEVQIFKGEEQVHEHKEFLPGRELLKAMEEGERYVRDWIDAQST